MTEAKFEGRGKNIVPNMFPIVPLAKLYEIWEVMRSQKVWWEQRRRGDLFERQFHVNKVLEKSHLNDTSRYSMETAGCLLLLEFKNMNSVLA